MSATKEHVSRKATYRIAFVIAPQSSVAHELGKSPHEPLSCVCLGKSMNVRRSEFQREDQFEGS